MEKFSVESSASSSVISESIVCDGDDGIDNDGVDGADKMPDDDDDEDGDDKIDDVGTKRDSGCEVNVSKIRLTAMIAASFVKAERSAPTYPGVSCASLLRSKSPERRSF